MFKFWIEEVSAKPGDSLSEGGFYVQTCGREVSSDGLEAAYVEAEGRAQQHSRKGGSTILTVETLPGHRPIDGNYYPPVE